MVTSQISKGLTKFFGSRNERLVTTYNRRVEQIGELEAEMVRKTDAELKQLSTDIATRIAEGGSMVDHLPQALAIAREVMDRAIGIRNIFNPTYADSFNRDGLPSSLQKMYDEIKAKADALEPVAEKGCQQYEALHHEWPTVPGWMQVEIPVELYNAVRELYPKSRPPFRTRPFDVQLIGGMVLNEGKIAEMKTGEGKTIVAPLACYLACLENLQCYVVTTNDYLVQRDRDWVFPFYYHLGLTVGAIHPQHMQPPQLKAEAYHCNVVYGTNSEFGFDYLRDNMKMRTEEQVQKERDFVIVDEVDSILIDEARTPLIISGAANTDTPRYELADRIARQLIQKQANWSAANQKVMHCEMRIKGLEGDIRNARDKAKVPEMKAELERLREEELPRLEEEREQHIQYYEVEMDRKAVHLEHEGVAEAQRIAKIGSFYVGNNIDMPHLLENALRAHVVYQRDKDYVVREGEVIIVDENTGRLMVGRQWSDGLHQAVECKENVKIKQETQTLATVTVQNYFKLFKRTAGMTGTAMTEATEFMEIYGMEVVAIPTNVPVIRDDRNDLIFLSQKDKWNAILDEIKHMHDVGRPILVGTTSVEKSEHLSEMLTKRHRIEHSVLNAKQHEREAGLVEAAGSLGAVMIATNMAGRGTDIKLQPIPRDVLVRHWQTRNLLPAKAKSSMSDDELIAQAYRHLLQRDTELKAEQVEALSDAEVRRALLIYWVQQFGEQVQWYDFKWYNPSHWFGVPPWHDSDSVESMTDEQLTQVLDHLPGFLFHRLRIYSNVEEMGGLHIIGTERHEARRIDNQLRGRAGRQGDNGSSRFFISLEDDLMQIFAQKWVMSLLPKMGMKEGDALEHKMVTNAVEKAQRKVEERNYQIRKNLLEYDEVMEYQRNGFYTVRQQVLEGRDIEEIIFHYIGEAVADATYEYLDKEYVTTQIAEWCRTQLDVSVEPGKLRGIDDLNEIIEEIKDDGSADVAAVVETTLGEYMSNDVPPDEWDLKGLSSWAMSRFGVNLSVTKLRKMNIDEVREILIEAAQEQLEKKDMSGLAPFLDPLWAHQQLANWANQKFDTQIEAADLKLPERDDVVEKIVEMARTAYHERELNYPIEFVLEMAFNAAQQDPEWASRQLSAWAKQRFDFELTSDQIVSTPRAELQKKLVEQQKQWMEGDEMDKLVAAKLEETQDAEVLADWCEQRFAQPTDASEFAELSKEALHEALVAKGKAMLRSDLTTLERFVLLQILDAAWKDHLYAMDRLKDSVNLQGYAEKDPRIVYKGEGAKQFSAMQAMVRDRVTDLIFRARLSANVEMRNVYDQQQARQDEAGSAFNSAAERATEEAQRPTPAGAGRSSDRPVNRRQARAADARERSSSSRDTRQRKQKRRR